MRLVCLASPSDVFAVSACYGKHYQLFVDYRQFHAY